MNQVIDRVGWSPAEFAQRHGIGKSTLYRMMKAGQVKAVKIGSRTVITADAEKDWLAAAPAYRSTTAA